MLAEQTTARTRRSVPALAVLLSASGIAVLGQGMALTAAPLMAASLTRSPLAVSAVTAAAYVAVLIFGLPAGALADRWPLRRLMVVTDLARFLLLAGFTVAVVEGVGSVWMLVVVVLLASGWFGPSERPGADRERTADRSG